MIKQVVSNSSTISASSLFLVNMYISHHHSANDLTSAKSEAAPSNSLGIMPPELLLMIALQLPLSDAAVFALTDRRLSTLNGPTYWPCLRARSFFSGHRRRFLKTLARGLPSWFYCPDCEYLHPRDRVHLPGPFNRPLKEISCFETNPYPPSDLYDFVNALMTSLGSHSYHLFYFHHLQLAMLRYYLGPSYGISTDIAHLCKLTTLAKASQRGEERQSYP